MKGRVRALEPAGTFGITFSNLRTAFGSVNRLPRDVLSARVIEVAGSGDNILICRMGR